VIDLPELKGLAIASTHRAILRGQQVFVRLDSGAIVLVATLEQWDFLVNAAVAPTGGSLLVQSYWNAFEVKLDRADDGTIVEPSDARTVRNRPANLPFRLPPVPTRLGDAILPSAKPPFEIPVRGDFMGSTPDGLYLLVDRNGPRGSKCSTRP